MQQRRYISLRKRDNPVTQNFSEDTTEDAQPCSYICIQKDRTGLEKALSIGTWIVAPVVMLGIEVYKLAKHGDLPETAFIYEKDARRSWQFPQGAPEYNCVYKSHPFDRSVYIPLAKYNDFILEETLFSIVRFCLENGAISISVTVQDIQDVDIAGKVGDKFSAIFDSKLGFKSKKSSKMSWKYTGSGKMAENSTPSPFLPSDHFKAIIEMSRHNPGCAHDIRLTKDGSLYVSADIIENFKNCGFSVGGHYSSSCSTSISVKITF